MNDLPDYMKSLRVNVSPPDLANEAAMTSVAYGDLQAGTITLINSSTTNDSLNTFNFNNPLTAFNYIVGDAIGSAIAAFIPGPGGAAAGGLISGGFNLFNKNMKNAALKEQVYDYVSDMINEAIEAHSKEVIEYTVSGIAEDLEDFVYTLNSYLATLESSDGKVENQLLDQVYSKFDALTTFINGQLPLVYGLAKCQGLPFYCQASAMLIAAYNLMFANRAQLQMESDYFSSNLKLLKREVGEISLNVKKGVLSHASNYEGARPFMNKLYPAGLSLLNTMIASIPVAIAGVRGKNYNLMELYGECFYATAPGPNDSSYSDGLKIMGDRLYKRPQMLQSLNTRMYYEGSKWNFNALTFYSPSTLSGTAVGLAVYSCQGGSSGQNNESLKLWEIGGPDYHPRNGALSIFRVNTDEPHGWLNYVCFERSDGNLYVKGNGTRDGRYNIQIPGYHFSGMKVDQDQNAGVPLCTDVHDGKIKQFGSIFKHTDGFSPAPLIESDASGHVLPGVALELSYNRGFAYELSTAHGGHAEPMLNKNVGILPTEAMHVYVISNENMTKARSVDTIFSGKYTLYIVCATPSTSSRLHFNLNEYAFNGDYSTNNHISTWVDDYIDIGTSIESDYADTESFVNLDDGGNCKYKTYSIEFSISRTLPKNHSLTLNIANHSGRQVNIASILFVTAPIPTPIPTELWPDGRKVEFYSEANYTGNLVATLTANYQPERDGVIAFRSFREIRPVNLAHATYYWNATYDDGNEDTSNRHHGEQNDDDHSGSESYGVNYYFTSLNSFNYIES